MEEVLLKKCVKSSGEGLIVHCHVRPGAKKTQIQGIYGEEALKIALKAPPVDGKANGCLLLYFAEKLRIPKGNVTLLSGQTSREKRVGIADIALEDFLKAFAGEEE